MSTQGAGSWTDVTEFVVYGRPQMETEILSGPTAPDSSATFTFGAETAARYECRVDGGAWATCNSPKTYPRGTLEDGPHVFEVRAFSAAGVPDPTPARGLHDHRGSCRRRRSIPRRPRSARRGRSFTFSGGASYRCTWDGVEEPCTSPASRTVPEGPHTFAVAAIDALGGRDPSPATLAFTVDSTRPATAITSATVAGATATFAFEAPDATASPSVRARRRRRALHVADIRRPRRGRHVFTVTATDAAGNSAPATRTVLVDTTAPETIISWAPPPILTTREFSVAFTASEAATFVCSVDGAAAAPCASPLQLTGLGEGAHSVVVTATDAAGNVDPTPARSDFTVIIPALPPAPSPTRRPRHRRTRSRRPRWPRRPRSRRSARPGN